MGCQQLWREEDGDEATMVTVWNIGNQGAGPVRWLISSKEVSRKYILEYRTDRMLNRVQQQVVEWATMPMEVKLK